MRMNGHWLCGVLQVAALTSCAADDASPMAPATDGGAKANSPSDASISPRTEAGNVSGGGPGVRSDDASAIGTIDGSVEDPNARGLGEAGSVREGGLDHTDSDCAAGSAALGGDIVNACGEIDPPAYRSMAAQLGSAAGITYRYGAAASGTPPNSPTWWHPPDQRAVNAGNGNGWNWQVGGPEMGNNDRGLDDYASNLGQALYVADGANDPGIDDVITYVMGRNTLSESPQLPWVYYGGGHPDVSMTDYAKVATSPLLQPIASGRCYGYNGWCSEGLFAFQNGALITAGPNTAHNKNLLPLPANKVPTSISVTSAGEFALVTVWDTQAVKGQVAVIAIAGTCDGCEPLGSSAGTPSNWWGEWGALQPGLRNYNNIGFLKVLGYVDLPIAAPTEIAASSDWSTYSDDNQGWLTSPDGKDGRKQPHDLPLADETSRQSFIGSGPNAKRYAQSGFAVIVSKSERKAVFLDLKPLFSKINAMYFGKRSDYEKTQSVGQADDQWPYSFSHAPDFAPTIIASVPMSDKPTAVNAGMAGADMAWVATADGALHVFTMAGYGKNEPASPADVVQVGTLQVGKNPTCLAYAKRDHGHPSLDIRNEVIAVSRGDRRIEWVSFDLQAQSGMVVRTLNDSRLVDPIWAEDNDSHGTESYILSVADYSGRSVRQYRYGPAIFWTNPGAPGNSVTAACQPPNGCGMGMSGGDPFEYGGDYATAGSPFRITSSNTP